MTQIKKRIYALSVCCGLVFGLLGGLWGTAAEPFTDVSSDSWYSPYIIYLSESGIVKGMTETEFVPQGTFTVAEAAAVITRYLGLEEQAEMRKNAMQILNVAGADKWYAGYLQLMYEAAIIDVTQYGCSVMGRHISIDDPSKSEAPVKRYEFAAFITRSFELDETEIRAAVGEGLGHEFIYGGSYDKSILTNYIPYIADYSSIPTDYSDYVLKAYYNGIFNGDDLGNFNPLKNLTRAEMAKVIAVVINAELRDHVTVETTAGNTKEDNISLPEEYYYTDADGNTIIRPAYTDYLLMTEAQGVSVFTENGSNTVAYTRQGALPSGYQIRIYHYTRDASGFDRELALDRSADTSYRNTYTPGDRLLITLVDLATEETVDAVAYTLSDGGQGVLDECRYLP